MLIASLSACNKSSDDTPENEETTITTEQSSVTQSEETTNIEAVNIESEFDPSTNMRYTLNDDGKSYSVCPEGLPDVIKELVFPGEYKGMPVTKVYGDPGDRSIETIIISEGIKEISIGFYYCRDIKNIYIPASVSYITECTFNCYATMGGHGHIKSNVIEKIVVAEENEYYYVDGNCLIDRRDKKIILGCNSSVIPNDGSVKSIGEAAFANCHAIESIIIPKSIIEIEYAAFDNCENLKQVYITSSVSKDNITINFDEEFIVTYDSEHVLYVQDAESLEIYSKFFGKHINIEIGIPFSFDINDPYEKFQHAIEENIYDKWLDNKLSEGIEAHKNIYADYLKLWKDEMAYTIKEAEKLFDDPEEYTKWKTNLEQWLYYSSEILKTEMLSIMGTSNQAEIIANHCELIRQKVIDTKYFLYQLEYQVADNIYESIDINWCYSDLSFLK